MWQNLEIATKNNVVCYCDTATKMVETQNAKAALFAGIDFGLVFACHALPYSVIDVVDVHIRASRKQANNA